MANCVICNKEVIVNPYNVYVYTYISVGKPSEEIPLYFHFNCFEKSIRKNSRRLKKKLTEACYKIIIGEY
jgi:hypothetical protein